ncbi:sodium/hydrogen exchanger 3-like isoform X1 [Zingiber officinale]|uniref:sodium/hydrogen exchanger 3-like isoform X1 n=1 Tax=Zingiber officinale TaxID=94328 RepID=UPI001C4CF714|nr:sodium/hydrogen exchanger 3-like isoform X1 [Zingiber officinale]
MDIDSLNIEDFLAIGVIFFATDFVRTLQILNQDKTPLLYSLVFGKGVVNDAIAVVLFNAIQNFVLVWACVCYCGDIKFKQSQSELYKVLTSVDLSA